MSDPVELHLEVTPAAIEAAASLKAQHGEAALGEAKAALDLAIDAADAHGILLWMEVCEVLATRQRLRIVQGRRPE